MTSTWLCIQIEFPTAMFHGCRDGGTPEWPPSPLRVFQSLTAAAADRWRNDQFAQHAAPALGWLAALAPPVIVAPTVVLGTPYRVAVPNNDLDLIAHAWAKGQEPKKQPAELKTLKSVRPHRMVDGTTVYFLWPLPAPVPKEAVESVATAACGVTHVGWGIDTAVAHARTIPDAEAQGLPGLRWRPGLSDGVPLRVPVPATLQALCHRHQEFLNRLSDRGFKPVLPLPASAYRTISYRSATDPATRPFAAFALLKPDASAYRPFDTVRHGVTVAAMLRHATSVVASRSGWDAAKVATFVLGHAESPGQPHRAVGPGRFAFLPLPSLEARGEGKSLTVGAIRRAVFTIMEEGHQAEIDWAGRALAGADLIRDPASDPAVAATSPAATPSVAILSRIPTSDKMIHRYTAAASTWATVTPVILPGYDDPKHYRRRLQRGTNAAEQKRLLAALDAHIDALLRKAIVQAGFPPELAQHAEIEYSKTGFWPGTALAMQYKVPQKLARFPRLHVRIRWLDSKAQELAIPGPICLGGGRYCGLGLFAALQP